MRGGKREGAGRKAMGLVRVSYRLPERYAEYIRGKAETLGVTQTEFLKAVLDCYSVSEAFVKQSNKNK